MIGETEPVPPGLKFVVGRSDLSIKYLKNIARKSEEIAKLLSCSNSMVQFI